MSLDTSASLPAVDIEHPPTLSFPQPVWTKNRFNIQSALFAEKRPTQVPTCHYYYFQKQMCIYSAGLSQYTVEQRELCSCGVPAVKLSSGPHCRASSHHIDHLLQDVAGAPARPSTVHPTGCCAWVARKKKPRKNSDNISTTTTIATTMSSTSSTCIKK